MRRPLLAVANAVLVAAVVGVVVGSVARLLMRAVALLGEQETSFSLPVSAGIVAFFVIAVLPGAVVAALTGRAWRWLAFVPTTGLLFVGGVAIARSDIEEAGTNDLEPVQWVGIYGLAGVILLMVLVQPVLVVRLVDRRVRPADADRATSGTLRVAT